MYQALRILNSRPFISDSHLQTLDSSEASSAFSICVEAASEIDKILKLYEQHFCLKSCPYFISYATYASGTIHARIAAQRPIGSPFHQMLRRCLEILATQQEQCHAPRQSMKALLRLAKRLNVDVGSGLTAAISRTDRCDDGQLPVPPSMDCVNTATTHSMSTGRGTARSNVMPEDIDIEAIIQSFDPGWQQALPLQLEGTRQSTLSGADPALSSEGFNFDDFLNSTFVGDQNGNLLDPLFGLNF